MTAEPRRGSFGLTRRGQLQLLSLFTPALLLWGGLHWGMVNTIPFTWIRSGLDRSAGDGSADLYTPELHGRIVTALSLGLWGAVILVVVLYWHRREARAWLRSGVSESRSLGRSLARSIAEAWPALLGTGVVAALVRWPFMHLPMRFDESYTYLQYASQPLFVTVSRYDAPNNHVFHSVLAWLAIRIGGNSPEVIRAPAFLCGVLTAVVAAWWGSRRGGRWTGLVIGCVVAVSSILVEYSVNARGYTLVHLLVLLLGVVVDEWSARPLRATLWWAAGLAALALWTMPISLYPMILLASVFVGLRPRLTLTDAGQLLPAHRPLADWGVAAAVTIVLTLLLYAPLFVVSGVRAVTSSGSGQYHGFYDWGIDLGRSGVETLTLLRRDQPVWSIAVLISGFLIGGVWGDSCTRRVIRWSLLGVCLSLVVVALQRVVPPPRTWLFIWPPFCCLAIAGGDAWAGRFGARCRGGVLVAVLALCGVWPGVSLFRGDSLVTSREAAICLDAQAVILDLQPMLEPDEPIIAVTPASAPLAFYAQRHQLAATHFFRPDTQRATTKRAVVVASKSPSQSVEDVLAELQLKGVYSRHRVRLWREYPVVSVFVLLPLETSQPLTSP